MTDTCKCDHLLKANDFVIFRSGTSRPNIIPNRKSNYIKLAIVAIHVYGHFHTIWKLSLYTENDYLHMTMKCCGRIAFTFKSRVAIRALQWCLRGAQIHLLEDQQLFSLLLFFRQQKKQKIDISITWSKVYFQVENSNNNTSCIALQISNIIGDFIVGGESAFS